MNILLIDEMILKDGLTYEQACEALHKAGNHPLASELSFFMTNDKQNKTKWVLCARHRELNARFCKQPEDFVIEIGQTFPFIEGDKDVKEI